MTIGSSVYIDVGANLGAIALPVPQADIRVIAAEANRGFPIDWSEPFGLVMIEAMACGTRPSSPGRAAQCPKWWRTE